MVSLVVNIKKDLQGKNMKFSSCFEEFRYSTMVRELEYVLSPTAEIRKLPRKKANSQKRKMEPSIKQIIFDRILTAAQHSHMR